MHKPATPVITVVGGGFAGTALVLQLRRQPVLAQARIHLVEPRPTPGPGLAYSARRPEYLLNVRSGSLSLYPDQPDHFAAWMLAQPESAAGPPEFASRAAYGRYLHEELTAAMRPSAELPLVELHTAAAVAAPPLPDGRRTVHLTDGTSIESDYVVLALGNFPPPPPAGPDLRYLEHPGYHADPWAADHIRRIGPEEQVLLIGSGLTAVDVLLALRQDGHRAPITVVSRHGRWPAAHEPATTPYPSFFDKLAHATTVNEAVAAFKRELRVAAAQNIGWQPVLDALRPDLGRIWALWSLAEQYRFLQHLAGLWAVGRHRSPPQNTAAVTALIAAGLVQMRLGTAREIIPDGSWLRVRVGPYGEADSWLTVQHVINCAGPLLDYNRIADALVVSLREDGQLCPDPLRLGILTDAAGALLDENGTPAAGLFTLGSSRRPAYFESTAVPEIRRQALALATEIAGRESEKARRG